MSWTPQQQRWKQVKGNSFSHLLIPFLKVFLWTTKKLFFRLFILLPLVSSSSRTARSNLKKQKLIWICLPLPLSGFRQRRREVLWESDSSLEGTCPHLLESVPCDDPACYLWQVQQEERCIPAKGPCGPGAAARNITCVNTEGNERPRTASHATERPGV